MARLTFPDEGSRLLYDPDTGILLPVNTRVYLYLDSAATQPATDLLDGTGNPVTVGYVASDAYRRVPIFSGPNDGRDTLYAVVNGGPVTPMYAREDDRLDALGTRVSTLEADSPATAVQSVNGHTGTAVTVTKADVGLGNADNTSDVNKPVSTAQAAADALAAQKSANLSDLASAATARTNLGLSTAATQPSTAFDASGAAAAEQTRAQTAELARLLPRGAWVTGTVYAVNDEVTANGVAWRCVLAHTAGATFSADPTKWERFGVGQVVTTAPSSPTTDDLWYDKANDLWKRWTGTAWKAEGSGSFIAKAANSIVWLGDSVTGKGGLIVGDLDYDPQGFWVWAQDFLGHRLWTIKNAGNAGENSTQILARVQTDVVANSPGWCHVLAGTNDIGQGVAVATSIANLGAILDQLEAASIRAIIGTIPPRNTYTGTMLADTFTLNAWIRDQARRRKGLVVVDYHATLVDAGTSGNYAANMTAEGLHPSFQGAARMGRTLANALSPIIPAQPFLSASEAALAGNLLANGRFNTGGSGSAPAGWNGVFTGTAPTYSKTVRTDDINGSWQTVALPSGTHGGLIHNAVATGWAVGDRLFGTVEYAASGLDAAAAANTLGFYLTLKALDVGNAVLATINDHVWVYGSQANFPAWDRSGVLQTPALTLPAGTVTVQMVIQINGGGTYNLDRAAIYNATTYGLATS